MTTDNKKKIAIIGSGPAGFTAAIYTSRASIDTTVYTGMEPGGQLTLTTEVENFPGFPNGIMGPELMSNMQQQAARFGSHMLSSTVSRIHIVPNQGFAIQDTNGNQETYDAVIISSGAKARYLGLAGEEKYYGKGYHTCATCDGFFYKGKNICVIGGGDSAMEEANFLTKFANTVTIVNRTSTYKASTIMLNRAKSNPKIKWIENSEVSKLLGENKLEQIELTNTQTQEKVLIKTDGIFLAIGHTPNTQFAQGLLTADELGYLKPKIRTMSEIDGIFIAGDVSDRDYRQAITAAGEGCKAAIDAEKWLENQR